MRTSIVKKNDDIIYYNGSVTNNQTSILNLQTVVAKFSDQRSQAILDKASDYYASVIRWSLPTTTIPIAIIRPINFLPSFPPASLPNTDPNFSNLSIILSWWNGTNYVDFVSYLKWIPQNGVFPAPTNGDPVTPYPLIPGSNEFYWYMFSYTQLVVMINNAFTDAFTRLKSMFGAAPGTVAPQLQYDATTNLYNLVCQTAFIAPAINPADPSNPDPNARYGSRTAITIWMNLLLSESNFFPGWNVCFAGQDNISRQDPNTFFIANKLDRIIIQDLGNNVTGGLVTMTTEFPVLSNTVEYSNIILVSNTLPFKGESINPSLQNVSATNTSLQIISDYTNDLFKLDNAFSLRIGVLYDPKVYRLIDLNGDNPLTTINVQALWVDNIGLQHNIFIKENSTFNFKMMFIKKTKLQDLINSGMKFEFY